MQYILLALLLFTFQSVKGQKLIAERTLRDARAMSYDEIGNTYIIYDDNSIVQYNEKGDSLANFQSVQNGRLTHIDTRNPLKLLLFYPDFSKIIILDRMLSLKNEIDLRQLGIFQVGAVGLGQDGNFWVYDVNNVQLLKIDENLNTINKSEDLRSSIQSFPAPISLEENDRKVYLLDKDLGIFVFDQFANFLNRIEIKNIKHLQAFQQSLLYTDGHKLINLNPITGAKQSLDLPLDPSFINATMDKGKMYFLYKNKLQIFSLAP